MDWLNPFNWSLSEFISVSSWIILWMLLMGNAINNSKLQRQQTILAAIMVRRMGLTEEETALVERVRYGKG